MCVLYLLNYHFEYSHSLHEIFFIIFNWYLIYCLIYVTIVSSFLANHTLINDVCKVICYICGFSLGIISMIDAVSRYLALICLLHFPFKNEIFIISLCHFLYIIN